MASDPSFADYVCDQISAAGPVSCRKMFGEYAIYCHGKVVALVCDNQLFVKATVAGHTLIGSPVLAPNLGFSSRISWKTAHGCRT